MNKKVMSTVLLFAVFIGFLWWGLSQLSFQLQQPIKDGEQIVYSFLLIICSFVALGAILMLPRKRMH